MRVAHTILAVFAIVGFVQAANFDYLGGASAWWAYYLANGKALMKEAFKTCKEYKNGAQTASASPCMLAIGEIVFESAFTVFAGGYVVNSIKGSGNTETQSHNPPNRLMARMDSDETARHLLLKQLNQGFTHEGLLATHTVPSHVHPDDGIAIRMNVHGDNSTMHVHTNGTSAMVLFDNDIMLQERELLPSFGRHFKFSGIDGIKFQAHTINKPPADDYHADKKQFLNRFVLSNLQPESIMSTHDKWEIQVCNRAGTATFFYSKFEAKENGFSKTYDHLTPKGCK